MAYIFMRSQTLPIHLLSKTRLREEFLFFHFLLFVSMADAVGQNHLGEALLPSTIFVTGLTSYT